MKEYVVELERTESGRYALTITNMPGLLILGATADEVLARARAAIQFYSRDRVLGPEQPDEVVSAAGIPRCRNVGSTPNACRRGNPHRGH